MWHYSVICKTFLEGNNFYIFLAISPNSLLLILKKKKKENEIIPFPPMGEIKFRSDKKKSTPLHPKFTFINS